MDFFKVKVLVEFLGVTIFSELVFKRLLSLILFVGVGVGLGDFNNLGESGGVGEVLVWSGGDVGGGSFLIEFLLSMFGTLLQVGWRTGLPLILATGDVAVVVISMPTVVTLVLELHILLFGFVWLIGIMEEWCEKT